MSKNTLMPFEQALLDATLEEFSDIPSEDEIEATFSTAFTQKANKLVQNSKRKSWYYVNTTLKRAVLVAAVITILATTALAVPAVREAIIRFFVHDQGTHFEFSFEPEQAADAPECIETVYSPTYIPAGYDEFIRSITVAGVTMVWGNSDNCWIYYNQYPIPINQTGGGINSEETSTQYIYLNGYEIFRIESAETVTYVWTNYEYRFSLMCEIAIPETEMQKIFSSVQIDENAVIPASGPEIRKGPPRVGEGLFASYWFTQLFSSQAGDSHRTMNTRKFTGVREQSDPCRTYSSPSSR